MWVFEFHLVSHLDTRRVQMPNYSVSCRYICYFLMHFTLHTEIFLQKHSVTSLFIHKSLRNLYSQYSKTFLRLITEVTFRFRSFEYTTSMWMCRISVYENTRETILLCILYTRAYCPQSEHIHYIVPKMFLIIGLLSLVCSRSWGAAAEWAEGAAAGGAAVRGAAAGRAAARGAAAGRAAVRGAAAQGAAAQGEAAGGAAAEGATAGEQQRGEQQQGSSSCVCGVVLNLRQNRHPRPDTLGDFVYFLAGLECVGRSFAYVAHFGFLRDVWIRTQRAGVACRHATNLAMHPLTI